MADVTVPAAPALSRIPNVELIHTGTWSISTGVWTVTPEDITNAVAALQCPAVGRPILKLGHTDPRFDGEPAVGYISNVAATKQGHTLVGDYEGMPGWLGDVIASAYPNRSVEGEYDFRCSLGHTHPFVLTGVALLGVTPPGIGTLDSLQDIAALYGVAAKALSTSGFLIRASVPGGTMPNPQPRTVAATVTSEDVRRAFYEQASWEQWICEVQLNPLQLIVCDDEDGELSRIPVKIGSGDGSDAVTFGAPVPVVVRYEDVPNEDADEAVAASRLVFASRAESRAGVAATTHEPPAEPVDALPNPTPEVTMAEATGTTLREALLARLGVTDADADEATLLAALDEALDERVEPAPTPAELPPNTVAIDQDVLQDLQVAAAEGREARQRQRTEERDTAIAAAIRTGRIPVSRREHWEASFAKDFDGSKSALASLAPGLIPVEASGAAGDGSEGISSEDRDLIALGFGAAVEGANV